MSNYDRNAYSISPGVARTGAAEYDLGLRSYMLGIYNYMTLALAVSALVAWGTFMVATTSAGGEVAIGAGRYLTPLGQTLWMSPLKWVIMLAPLAFVFVLSWRFERMSQSALFATFLAFAAVMGLSMSWIFVAFKLGSIVQTLFITAAAFGGLSLYGYTTKRSLSAMGSFLVMGVWGLLLASVVNIFLGSSAFQFGISVLGVLIFAGLTAWDTQRLKEQYDYVAGDATMMGKASIMGALTLYLDFINMFQFLLSIVGQRNSN
jgi:hypothetical protein